MVRAGGFGDLRGHFHHDDETLTLKQAAGMVDAIDGRLFQTGTIGIKSPDVWGQNRMTKYRAEFEGQMAKRLGSFQTIVQAAQRRSDSAVFTNATSIAATVAATKGNTPAKTAPAATAVVAATPAAPAPASPASSAGASGSGSGDPTALLDDISKKLDALQAGVLPLPANISNFATKEAQSGVGLEPTVQLDEEARYVNQLHQLRRINAGDDRTDMAGYGLYLLRMPISLMPGPESRKGKGAVVTMEARHDLTPDLLANTFRDVAVLDATYALTQVINEEVHKLLCLTCETSATNTKPAPCTSHKHISMYAAIPPVTMAAGPRGVALHDLRIILGPDTSSSPFDPKLPPSLGGCHNRLKLLVDWINEAQQDPYRHDPSTMSILQGSLNATYLYMRDNSNRCVLFQLSEVEKLGELLLRRDFHRLVKEREAFLKSLVNDRFGYSPSDWSDQVSPSDVLAFEMLLQFAAIDAQLKEDMKVVAQRNGRQCGEVDHLSFYEFYPTPDAQEAFNSYVATKWPIKVYSVDPVIEQQNILDAFSRRSELQLALAVSVAKGSTNFKNATAFARRLDLDLETIGLNRTAVGFGAGETTFGWMFYPRVQTPPTQNNFSRIGGILVNGGPGNNYDLKNRRIEPGQRECIAMIISPNFIPSLRLNTIANWFDVTGHCARQQLTNGEMLEYSHKIQQAKNALTRICDSGEYRPSDLTHLTQRVKQLESLLPTQDYHVDLLDEGDLLGSEIFSSNATGLSPGLLAWYGEHPQEGKDSSIFMLGRGFSVSETQVIAGGVNIPDEQKRLISRNVLQIIIPANARAAKTTCDGQAHADPDPQPKQGVATAGLFGQANAEPGGNAVADGFGKANAAEGGVAHAAPFGTANAGPGGIANAGPGGIANANLNPKKPTPKPCTRAVFDIHIATPNGISNHLYVECDAKPDAPKVKNIEMTTTTTTSRDMAGNVSTTTKFVTTPPGIALPPLTILPLGTQLPTNLTLSPGAVTGAPNGSILPGMTPPADKPTASPTPVLNPAPVLNPNVAPTYPPGTTTPTPPASPAAPAPSTTPTPAPAGMIVPKVSRRNKAMDAEIADREGVHRTAFQKELPPLPQIDAAVMSTPDNVANTIRRPIPPLTPPSSFRSPSVRSARLTATTPKADRPVVPVAPATNATHAQTEKPPANRRLLDRVLHRDR